MTYSVEVRSQVFDLLAQGMARNEVARRLGIARSTVGVWASMAGMGFRRGRGGVIGVRLEAPPIQGHGGRLALEHRMVIQTRLADGKSLRWIAKELGVAASTVSREVRRGQVEGKYRARLAQHAAQVRLQRPRRGKLETNQRLRREVLDRLVQRHSPQQIAHRLAQDFAFDKDMQVSHETIYQALYVQGKGSLRAELDELVRTRLRRRTRKPQSQLARRTNKSWITDEVRIQARPAEVADRAVPGHWEGDLVIGKQGQSALITLAERTSRFLLVRRLTRHDSHTVADALSQMIQQLPHELTCSITWDQGVEMAQHRSFTIATDCKVYFCDPRSPWQRGTNENTNGLVRDYYPKGSDFTTVTDEEIQAMQDEINDRPRQTLNWATPRETLGPLIVASTT